MKRPQVPPELSQIEPDLSIMKDPESMDLVRDYNERYLHWDRLQYYDCGRYGRENLWYAMKLMRSTGCKKIDLDGLSISYNLPDRLQKPLHQIDLALSAGSIPMSGFDDKRKIILSISSMMEESIASSQIEGAATATKEAKKMLRDNRSPNNKSERMILNNYKAMEFIRSNLDNDLSLELIRELHAIISHDTLESTEYEGTFRSDNSVAIRDIITGETYYEPVSHERIMPMMESLCEFANDDEDYIHPIVKGILIHYIVAYIHPFMDGNGRTARSLFYWYTMKKGYTVMEYLSLSKAIKGHKGRYEEAYQLCETDRNDVTYFIDYNMDMISRSMDAFTGYLMRKLEERKSVREMMDIDDLTKRQTDILASLVNADSPQTVYDLASRLGVSPQTIRNDLMTIIDKGYVKETSKAGHRQRFVYSGNEH